MLAGPGKTRVMDDHLDAPGAGEVVIRSTLSTLKHGTEMMAYRGDSPFLVKQLNPDLRVFEPLSEPEHSKFYPRPMGNMTAGIVEAVGPDVRGMHLGDAVFGWLPIADRHVVAAHDVRLLGRLTRDQAVCVDPASFALGAVLDGAVADNDTVLVTGLGAIGLLVIQYCKLRGATVIAGSSFDSRRTLARRYGADLVLDTSRLDDLGLAVKQETRGGASLSIECSGRYETLHNTIRATRQCGRIVCVGFYAGSADALHLGEEFFHNRISLLASLPAHQWSNPVRGPKPLYAADLQHTVIHDMAAGNIVVDGLLHPRVDFAEVQAAVRMIDRHPEQVIKVSVQY